MNGYYEQSDLQKTFEAWVESRPLGSTVSECMTDGKVFFIGAKPVLFPGSDGLQLSNHAPEELEMCLKRQGLPYTVIYPEKQS